jgi:hypothetical protein
MAAPVPAPILRSQAVSNDVVIALTLFQEAFLNAFRGYAAPEMVGLGLEDSTASLAYKMPMSVGSSAWAQITGGVQYDNVGEIMLPITIPPYAAAVAVEVLKLQSDQWTGWGERPGEMAFNARNIGEAALAAALEAGGTTLSVENFLDTGPAAGNAAAIKIFQANHPYSPLVLDDTSVTWTNDYTGSNTDSLGNDYSACPLNLSNIDRVANNANHVVGMNGKDFQPLEWWAVVVPPALSRQAKRYFTEQGGRNDTITEGASGATVTGKPDQFPRPNTAKDLGIQVIVNRYLTNTTTWYPVFRSPASRKAPWVCINQVPAHAIPFTGGQGGEFGGAGMQQVNIDEMGIEWIIDDLSSTAYKHGVKGIPKGHVGIQGIRRVGAGITVPKHIARCQAT